MGSLLSGIGLAEGIILECKEGHRFHFLWSFLLLFYVCRQVSTAHDSVLRYNSSYPNLEHAEKGLEPELIFDEYEITANEDMLNSAVTHKTKPG